MITKRFGWMFGLAAIVLAVAGLVFSGASAAPLISGETWWVYVSHDLNGGHWDAVSIDSHVLTAPIGQNMPADGLDQEKRIEPIKENASFRGWSVRFTDPANGSVIYDSGDEVWDLDHPFDYYPDNPLEMDCLMTARWVVDMPLPNPVGSVVDMLPPIPARRGLDMPSPNPVGRDGDMLFSDSDDCTRFTMVEHVTVPPGTVMKPNQNFQKIWRVRNDSTCTWTPEFYWEFDGGYDSDAPWKTYIPYNVDPGETVDIAMEMKTLYYEGEFWGNWILAYPGLYWEFTPVNERKYISYNYIVKKVWDQDWLPEINDTSLTVIDEDLLNFDLPEFFPEPTIAWPPVIR